MQQNMLYSHLASQFADRCAYWRKRGLSRTRGLEVTLICDGMDQGKFGVPRSHLLKAKQFDSWNRPRLRAAAVIIHGWALNFYLSEPNLCKDSNTSVEILAHSLTELRDLNCDLATMSLTVQSDNTVREIKNGICMRWMSALVSESVIKDGCFSFLRSGHSHEDIDQIFGQCAEWVRRKLPVAQSSADFVSSVNVFLQQLDRPHDLQRACYKLDQTRDWCLGFHVIAVREISTMAMVS